MSHIKSLDKKIQMTTDNISKGGGPFAAIIVESMYFN